MEGRADSYDQQEPSQDSSSPLPTTAARPAARHDEAVVDVAAELSRLRTEAAAARKARDMALEELLALQDAVNRVSAVCDMAEWAADVDGSDGVVTANVQDVRQALRPRDAGSR